MHTLLVAIGLLGPILFLWAYAMLSLGRWNGNMLRPHLLNLLGALAVLLSLLAQWNMHIFVLELCWAAVSLHGIWRTSLCSRRTPKGRGH